MTAHSRQPRGAPRSRLLSEVLFVLLLVAVFGTAYAASAFDFRRSESRAAVELQTVVATQLSRAQSAMAQIAELEGRFDRELFPSVGVSVSELREASKYPAVLTRVLLEQDGARDAWANILNCPVASPATATAESLMASVSDRSKIQSATEADRQALVVMLADLSARLEALKARAKNLEHVRFMVEADRLDSPGSK